MSEQKQPTPADLERVARAHNVEEVKPRCEEVSRNGFRPCPNPAKWRAPGRRYRMPQRRALLCGQHKHRWEDAIHKCEAL